MPSSEFEALENALNREVLGNAEASRLLLVALLARGHVLIEGAPGVGKTRLAHTLATRLGAEFRRVQFTPDLLPSDLLGYNLYQQQQGKFEFIQGPVFCHVLLADEINRTSPRVQSALLETMNEGQVSIDGTTYELPEMHFVIATQNDIFATGTFPLPEPQLDRFLLSIRMDLPDVEVQKAVLMQTREVAEGGNTSPCLELEQILELQAQVRNLPASEAVAAYVVELCESLRLSHGDRHSVSVRASLALLDAARAHAFIEGHPAVYPEDVRAVLEAVMRHRLAPDDPALAAEWVAQALDATPVP